LSLARKGPTGKREAKYALDDRCYSSGFVANGF
jgi:hypothetical protein